MSDSSQRPSFGTRWLDFVLRHHRAVLIVGVVVTIFSAWLTSRLVIDTDLRALLPRDTELDHSYQAVERDFGSVDSINIVIKGEDVEARHALADAVAAHFEGHPLLSAVDAHIDDEFFVERALYYLTDDEMDELSELVTAWQHHGLCSRAPELCTVRPDPRAPDKLERFIEAKKNRARERIGFERYYEREGIDATLVFLRPREPATVLAFSEKIVGLTYEEMGEIMASEGPWSAAGVTYNLTGSYAAKSGERGIIKRDMRRSLAVGMGGVLLVLYLLFRSFRALLTLTVPLLMGLTWAMGMTQILLGHLNTMTSLISSVLLGLGIDAGIHLLSRARRERLEHDDETAIRRAFASLLAPLLVASTTTIGAFIVMTTSEYPAFQEFGIVAGTGMALCLVAMITVYPALLRLVGVKEPRPRAEGRRHPLWLGRFLTAKPGLAFFGLLTFTVACVTGVHEARKNGFERSARELQSDTLRDRIVPDAKLISEIFGKNVHAGLLHVRDYKTMAELYAHAKARHAERVHRGDTVVAELVAAPSFLPNPGIDQVKRREAIVALTEDFDDSTWAKLEGKGAVDEFGDPLEAPAGERDDRALDPEEAEALRAMIDAEPFGPEDLPAPLLARLRGENGSWALYAYPNYDPSDIIKDVAYVEETREYGAGLDGMVFVGEPAVPAGMYILMRDQWAVIVGMALILVFGIVWWQVRSFSRTMMTLLPLIVGVWWLVGFMGWSGIKFTLVNVPVLPAILGISVDNGVYLATAMGRRGESIEGLEAAVDGTARAILAATATTVCGFASFLVADSGGLRSIGMLAVVGISMAAAATLFVLPTLGALALRRRDGVQTLAD